MIVALFILFLCLFCGASWHVWCVAWFFTGFCAAVEMVVSNERR